MSTAWPTEPDELISVQVALGGETPAPWNPLADYLTGGAWICFRRGLSGPGSPGDQAWAAAVVMAGPRIVARHLIEGRTPSAYIPGLLALRLGPLLEVVVRRLAPAPDVLLLDATGRDHPRRCGLATHLGAVLDLPTVGVTHRPLNASGAWPADEPGATSPLVIGTEQVATWLRTRPGTRPLVVHPGWQTDLDSACQIVSAALGRHRTPEPLRRARQAARRARAD